MPPDIASNNIRKSPHSAYSPTDTPGHALPVHGLFIYLSVIRRFPMGLDLYFIKRPAETTAD
ncbi:hypothetical protein FG586_22910, partial [Salmonella enterica subsp. enterica serovar Corvallis]